jgi:hypothetical protein
MARVIRYASVWLGVLALGWECSVQAQLDPEKRRLIQVGYNQPLEGRAPIAAYGFYYYNNPSFVNTNMTLRVAVAPIYFDGELGFKGLITPYTDLGVGFAGGGFADTYSEIRGGRYLKDESFTGHAAEISSSVYHRLNPDWRVPAWWIGRLSLHHSIFERDSDTANNFEVPDDLTTINLRTGIRVGGREPNMTSPLAFEMSVWYEAHVRDEKQRYGFNDDREINQATHLFWARALLKYTFEQSQQYVDVGLTLGATINPDRFGAYRLGGVLPFVSEFPLSIPGYYFQEISVEKFALLNAEYSFPFTPQKNWRLTFYGAMAPVDYLDGQEEPRYWHAGLGGGVTYVSPRGAWFASLVYGYGFNAIRKDGYGANQVGLLFQYDFDAVRRYRFRRFEPNVSPYTSKGGERLFR